MTYEPLDGAAATVKSTVAGTETQDRRSRIPDGSQDRDAQVRP